MRLCLLTTALILVTALPCSLAQGKTRILLIGHKLDHPPATHSYMKGCRLLARCLEQTRGVETIVSNGWPKDPEMLEGVSAIVLYSGPGGDLLLGGPHRKVFESLMKKGVGFTAIHWATADNDLGRGPAYLKILGGWFHIKFCRLVVSKSRLTQVDPKHPICRGWRDYELTDEYYLDVKLLERAKPVLKVRAGNKDQVVAWVLERSDSAGGRSFAITLGHFFRNFGIEPFRRAIVNGILWTARREVPQEGAPCKIEAKDLVEEPGASETKK